jgi:putative ABC transport system substrate-binding protein
MTTRRALLIGLGAGVLSAPLTGFAQQQRLKVARIGLLVSTSASSYANQLKALIAGLRALGLVEGKNILIEYRWAEGQYERLPALAAELVQMKVDVLVVAAPPAVKAAQQATTTIPIVMVATPDPVGSGFVASFSRPGRNITGVSNIHLEVSSKYLELLRVAVPKLSRVTVLVNPGHPNHPDILKRVQATAQTTGVKVSPVEASTASQIEAALVLMKQERAGALIVLPDGFFLAQARRIAELAAQHRLPTMFFSREAVESGGLMSYGQNLAEQFYRQPPTWTRSSRARSPEICPSSSPRSSSSSSI